MAKQPIFTIANNLTPTATVDNSINSATTVGNNATPASSVDESITPTSTVDNSLTPTSVDGSNLTPTAAIDNSLTPTSAATNNLTPGPTPTPTLRIGARTRIYLVRRANLAAAHNLLQASSPSDNPNRHKTRQRTSAFPFLRLPPELRNRIYALALPRPTPRLEFVDFRVPALLHASRQLRREALGLVVAGTRVRIDVRSSFCVPSAQEMRAAVLAGRQFYGPAGQLALGAERKAWIEREELVFKDLQIGLLCYCCKRALVGGFVIRVREGGCEVRVEEGWTRNLEELQKATAVMAKGVRRVVAKVEARQGFVGFGYGDLLEIAECLDIGKCF